MKALLQMARPGLLVAVPMAFLVGCTTSTPGSARSGPESSGSPVTSGSLVTSTPPMEGSGPEPPQPRQPEQPSVKLVRLPIGGGFTGDEHEAARCVEVRLASDIPKGVSRISVAARATFDHEGIFAVGGKGCGNQQPLCKEFTAQQTNCLLPVVQLKDSTITVTLSLYGTPTCVDKGSCEAFEKSANVQQRNIDLTAQSGVVGPSRSTSVSSTRVSNSPSTSRGS